MEHIVQFAIGIDDEGIRKHITESAEKQIIDMMYKDCKKAIIEQFYCSRSYYSEPERLDSVFVKLVTEAVDKVIADYKDEIIKNAANILADRLSRTKAARALKEES